MFEKKKFRIGQLELQVIMLQEMLQKMKEGGGLCFTYDFDFRLDLGVVQCLGKSIIVVNNCPICS